MVPEYPNSAIKALFVGLEQLSKEFEEVTDTDVRESLHMPLNYCFLDQRPVSYGMFSLEGDKSVAQVVDTFLSSVSSFSDVPKRVYAAYWTYLSCSAISIFCGVSPLSSCSRNT